MRRILLIGLLAIGCPGDPRAPAAVETTPATTQASAADVAYVAAQRQGLKADDASGRLALARFCQQHALWAEMAALAREVLIIDPASKPAFNYLRVYDENVPLPEDPAAAEALRKELETEFGHPFKSRNSRHFLIVYDTTDAFVGTRAGQFEKAYDSFFFWFNLHKLRPEFLSRRLPVILFKDRADYLAYGRKMDRADLKWAAGYYSQRANRSAFYDDATGPQAEKVEDKLEELRGIARDLTGQIDKARREGKHDEARKLTEERNDLNIRISQMAASIDHTVARLNASKTTHEAIHQLAFNTGIQTRLVDYPLWLSEGLACSFEMDSAAGRGPGIVNRGRAIVVKEALKAGTLLPLAQLLEGPPPAPAKIDQQQMGVYYAEGWALFHYLYTHHRFALEKYLVAYHGEPAGRALGKERHIKLFSDTFGDVAALEKSFKDFLKDLPGKGP